MRTIALINRIRRHVQITFTHQSLSHVKPLECNFCNPFILSRNISCAKSYKPILSAGPSVLLTEQPHRNAGHSKWQNIRHVKQANDMARAREITKFLNLIKAAVREQGSADPKQNSKLAQILAQAKDAKLPMSSFDRTLQNLKDKKETKSCIVPIRGPGNCLMLVDLEAVQLTKAKQQMMPILKKNRGTIMDDSVLYLFDHKGVLYCSELDGKPVTEDVLDSATEHAIESGANDVTFLGDHPAYGAVLEFTTEPTTFFKVKNSLEELKYKIEDAEVAYIPKKWVELNDEDAEAANKLYTKLSEYPEVQKVFVNIA